MSDFLEASKPVDAQRSASEDLLSPRSQGAPALVVEACNLYLFTVCCRPEGETITIIELYDQMAIHMAGA